MAGLVSFCLFGVDLWLGLFHFVCLFGVDLWLGLFDFVCLVMIVAGLVLTVCLCPSGA